MRFVFHNPQIGIWYKTPLFYFITRRKSFKKYEQLIDYFLEKDQKITVYIDASASSIPGRTIRKINLIPPILEFYLWCILNKINPIKVNVIKRIDELTKSDVLFTFLYGNFTSRDGSFLTNRESLINSFIKTKALKVVHLTHYMYNASIGSKHCENAKIDLFVAENNLHKNSLLFQNYYSWYKKDVYVLPFVPKDRFKKYIEFSERKNLAIATGTITFGIEDKDFFSFFGHSQVHPMRYQIYNNKERLKEFIDCFIHENLEGQKAIKINSNSSKIKKIYARLYSAFILKQKKYFSFDIVKKYNEYKMFIVPEEVNGLPGIGFVEGMACGSVYVGVLDKMYSDLGLVNDVHYIAYDGTLENLVERIKFYQNHQDKLENISNNGYEFIQNKLNKDKVVNEFFGFLEERIKQRDT